MVVLKITLENIKIFIKENLKNLNYNIFDFKIEILRKPYNYKVS